MTHQYCKVKTTRSKNEATDQNCKEEPCVPKSIIGIPNEACENCNRTF